MNDTHAGDRRDGWLVEAEGLVRIYKTAELEVVALQGLDLQLAEGESVAIAGRSGSGKTTLMNILAGIETPSAGRVRVAGHDLARMTEAEREDYRRQVVGYVWQHSLVNLWPELSALENVQVPMLGSGGSRERVERAERLLEALGLHERRHRPPRTIGWVFQSAGLLPLLSAEENVALALRILGHPEREAGAAARDALAAIGLRERAGHRGMELSGGEQQRVALARALVKTPALLIADEPTAQLDTETAAGILKLVRKAADSGTSVLLATHDPAATDVADRVLLMEDGLVQEAAPVG